MVTYLVTGGAGFIGSTLVNALLREPDARVVVLDAFTYAANPKNFDDPQNARLHCRRCDLAQDRRVLSETLSAYKPDVVFHLAAETHVDRSIFSPEQFLSANVEGTFRLLQALRHQPALLVHVSTDEVYGSMLDGAATEASAYAPGSPYAATKAASDHLVRAWSNTFGLPAIVTHCSNNYGPRQYAEKLIPVVITKALERKPIPIYGDGRNVRDWVFVEDHCEALRLIASKGIPGAVYNIGTEEGKTNLDVVESVLAAMTPADYDYRKLLTFVEDRLGHDVRYALDCRLLKSLGWKPRTPWYEGIRRTVRWYEEGRTGRHEEGRTGQYAEGGAL